MGDNPYLISKRKATLLLFAGVLSKMAHADENGNLPKFPGITTMGMTINLDSFTGVTVIMGGKIVTVTSAELFSALLSG